MTTMEKFQAGIERFLVPIAAKLNSQRHICAVRDSFILSFPLTMAGSLMVLLNFVFLSPDGFVAKLLKLESIIPNFAEYQNIFSPVLRGSADILAIFIVFLVARNLAKTLKADDLLTGLTAVSVYFIIYPDYVGVDNVNHLTTKFLGSQGLFVAIIVGLVVGELMAILSKSEKLEIKMPEQVPPAVARSFKVVIQSPLTKLGQNVGSVIVLAFICQILWAMGIHGPNTIAAVRDTMFAEAVNSNVLYAAQHGTAWGAPFPVTFNGLFDAFGAYGGSGATLGLVIALILFSKAKDQKSIAKLSLAPGIFNINEMVIFGLPIILNPIYIIPFVLAPIVNIIIGYSATCIFKIIPPVAYGVPWTTPGPLIPFLGTGGNVLALLIGVLCLAVSVLIYAPFVIAAGKASQVDDDNSEKDTTEGLA